MSQQFKSQIAFLNKIVLSRFIDFLLITDF